MSSARCAEKGDGTKGGMLNMMEEHKEEEEEEEAIEWKPLMRPCTPSAEEYRKHALTHLPFRNWCPMCIQSKGPHNKHGTKGKRPEDRANVGIPIVAMDYAFM